MNQNELNKTMSVENKNQQEKSIAFIDASNLFYGGEKSLGWKNELNL